MGFLVDSCCSSAVHAENCSLGDRQSHCKPVSRASSRDDLEKIVDSGLLAPRLIESFGSKSRFRP